MTQQTLGLQEYKKLQKSAVKKKPKKHEENLQLAVCNYIRTKYPSVIFNCDIASGMRMPIYVAARCKKMRSGRGYPDLFIAKSAYSNTHIRSMASLHYGLFIELKREGTKLQKRDGMWATPHIKEQADVLQALRKECYKAEFAVGYDEAIDLIDKYLK